MSKKIDKKINALHNMIDSNPKVANREALMLYENQTLSKNQISNLRYILAVSFWHLGNINNARKFALLLINEPSTVKHEAEGLYLIGNFELENKKHSSALDYYNRALNLCTENNLIKTQAPILNNIGEVYNRINQCEKALEFYKKSIDKRESRHLPISGIPETNICEIYIRQNELTLAKDYFQKAKNLFKLNNNIRGLGEIYNIFSEYFYNKKDYITTKKYLLTALNYFSQTGSDYLKIDVYINMSQLYKEQGDFSLAIEKLLNAEELIASHEMQNKFSNVYKDLSQLYALVDDHKAALDFSNQYNEILLNVFDEKIENKVNLIENKYKVKAIEHQNEIYKLKNIKLKNMHQEMQFINTIGKKITSTLDIDEIIDIVYKHLRKILEFDFYGFGTYNKDEKMIEFSKIIDKEKEYGPMIIDVDENIDNSFATWCIENKETIFINNYEEEYNDYKKEKSANIIESNPQSVIFVPLMIEREVLGFFTIQSNEKFAFDDNTKNFLETLSSFFAIAIKNSQHSKKLKEEIENKKEAQMKLKQANKNLYRKSVYDSLTDIPNRRFFMNYFDHQFNLSKRNQTELTLMIIDIDHFKEFNDYYGHIAGDECLITVSQLIQSALNRESDFVARYGGDEFLIVLPNTPKRGSEKVAERIIHTIEQSNIEHEHSKIADQLTVSIGIYSAVPTYNMTTDLFLKKADQALYRAKDNGKNSYELIKDLA